MSVGQGSRRDFLKQTGVAGMIGAGMALGAPRAGIAEALHRKSKHVLLISVDGIHAIDLKHWVEANPASVLAQLSGRGYTYTRCGTSEPSDSFPGLIALVTGGSPVSTGIWYDVAFDRKLFAPPSLGGGGPGTVTQYMEFIDPNNNRLDGGVPAALLGPVPFPAGLGIEVANLPTVDAAGKIPVYPWQFLRVNTIFNVAKAGGYGTAWADKHVGAYQAIFGPTKDGVDDYYSPEINSLAAQLYPATPNPAADQFTNSHIAVKIYDSLKVNAVVNQCKGLTSTGKKSKYGTPGIFGMNFQAVSVAQKLASAADSPVLFGGYTDPDGSFNTAVQSAMQYVDDALGEMVTALAENGILDHTTIIITAKHGQCPIDPTRRRIVPGAALDDAIKPIVGAGNYAVTADDTAYIWLKTSVQNQTAAVVASLRASLELNNLLLNPTPPSSFPPPVGNIPWPANPGIQEILWGDSLKLRYNDPLHDSRTPDIIVVPTPGVIWAGAHSGKLAEHGGLAEDDTHVALLVSNPSLSRKTIKSPVKTAQVAPTILKILGLDPHDLESVQKEHTDELPIFDA
jgi:hypothetical protein